MGSLSVGLISILIYLAIPQHIQEDSVESIIWYHSLSFKQLHAYKYNNLLNSNFIEQCSSKNNIQLGIIIIVLLMGQTFEWHYYYFVPRIFYLIIGTTFYSMPAVATILMLNNMVFIYSNMNLFNISISTMKLA